MTAPSNEVKRYKAGALYEYPRSGDIPVVMASDYDSLLAQYEQRGLYLQDCEARLAEVERERDGLRIAINDLKGSETYQCGLCNLIERSECYRLREENRLTGYREGLEAAATVADKWDRAIMDRNETLEHAAGMSCAAKHIAHQIRALPTEPKGG